VSAAGTNGIAFSQFSKGAAKGRPIYEPPAKRGLPPAKHTTQNL